MRAAANLLVRDREVQVPVRPIMEPGLNKMDDDGDIKIGSMKDKALRAPEGYDYHDEPTAYKIWHERG